MRARRTKILVTGVIVLTLFVAVALFASKQEGGTAPVGDQIINTKYGFRFSTCGLEGELGEFGPDLETSSGYHFWREFPNGVRGEEARLIVQEPEAYLFGAQPEIWSSSIEEQVAFYTKSDYQGTWEPLESSEELVNDLLPYQFARVHSRPRQTTQTRQYFGVLNGRVLHLYLDFLILPDSDSPLRLPEALECLLRSIEMNGERH